VQSVSSPNSVTSSRHIPERLAASISRDLRIGENTPAEAHRSRRRSFARLGTELAEQWPGFDNLAQSIVMRSHVERLKPVFLNLLDRDASKEPPLPFLIFERGDWTRTRLSDRIPTGCLSGHGPLIWSTTGSGMRSRPPSTTGKRSRTCSKSVLRCGGGSTKHSSTVGDDGTELDSRDGVKASIERAEAEVDSNRSTLLSWSRRCRDRDCSLNEEGPHTELLLGLDEVALFVGDSRHRYREFEETMEALQHGPNPVVVTTGQYSLPDTRESLIGKPSEDHWTHQQVPLEGADTEIIVRKRWLQKDSAGSSRVSSLISSMPDLSLEAYSPVGSADPDPVESYPFRRV